MFVAQVEPFDPTGIQMVCDYLERVESVITTKPEPCHLGFTPIGGRCISNAVVAVIRSTQSAWTSEECPTSGWISDSLILWAREIVEAEILQRTGLHVKTNDASAVSVPRYVSGPFPGGANRGRNAHTSSQTAPSYLAKLNRPTLRPLKVEALVPIR